MEKFLIEDRYVGDGEPCFIIAEAGSNHNGKLQQAKQLIDIAADAVVDAVKFQLFKAEMLSANRAVHEVLHKYEFRREWIHELKDYSESRNLIFMATPFDEQAVDLLAGAGVSAFKIASGDLTDIPLIKYTGEKGKPVLLSVGLGNYHEIGDALDALHATGNSEVALLHCIASYPTRPEDVNLRVINALQDHFKLPVGYSDHTMEIGVPIGAVALGACIVEKHFTINRTLQGPDHPFAMEPDELRMMVRGIRSVEKALGSGVKCVADSEKEGLLQGRRSVFAKQDIPEGSIISRDAVTLLRPATGIPPADINLVIGKKAKKHVRAFEPLTWDILDE